LSLEPPPQAASANTMTSPKGASRASLCMPSSVVAVTVNLL
jgi:hypothetical protein